MNLPRITLTILLALQATILAAMATDAFAKWAQYLALGAVFLGTIVQAFAAPVSKPTVAEAKKAASVPPVALGLLLLTMAFVGCKALSPSNVKDVENVVDFVEQDACVLAVDFAATSDVQQIAEFCNYVETGTKAAEDVLNRIVALQKSKAKAKDPAVKAKYAAKLAARFSRDAGAE